MLMSRSSLARKTASAIVLLMLLSSANELYAAATTNYTIPSDVQDAGGGEKAKSNNYVLSDTIGEGDIGIGQTANYTLNAGYRQPAPDSYIAIAGPASILIGTIVGTGQATASGSWIVTTDADGGYQLSWNAATAAMVSGSDTIAAFTPSVANTPDTWSVAAIDSEWGARLRSSSTDTYGEWGTDNSSDKWLNIATSSRVIVARLSRTSISGSQEIVQLRAEVGASHLQPTGTYTNTVTMTASAL